MTNFKDQILCGDCIDIMQKMPDASVDMIFADPPYFMQLSKQLYRPDATQIEAVNDSWDKFDNFAQYDEITLAWLKQAYRILKQNGSLWVIGTYHNIFRIGYYLQNLGFWILNDIIWIKTNPMPNFKGTRFANAHETLIWCTKNPRSKYTFHYESMKANNDDLQMRSDWYLPICNGRERLKQKDGSKVHTTQKPEALLSRIILASTHVGDLILDPFFGTGTTGAVAKKLGRHFIGIEQNKTYIQYAKKRLEKLVTLPADILNTVTKKQEPRITFGMLLDYKLLQPGQKLYDKTKKLSVIIQADGSVKYRHLQLSIHQMAARFQNSTSDSSNGWTYWLIRKGKNHFEILDTYRKQLRAQLFPQSEIED